MKCIVTSGWVFHFKRQSVGLERRCLNHHRRESHWVLINVVISDERKRLISTATKPAGGTELGQL